MLKIQAIDLVKTFGTTKAADHLSLDIPANTIYGLLGPNGAGKTTFIRMATTITRPDSGTLLFDGQPLHESHALQMGYMPEERGLYKKMSVLDQLVFFAEIKGMPHATARQEAIKWLKRLDSKSFPRAWLKKYNFYAPLFTNRSSLFWMNPFLDLTL
jgi:ABC-2 type transport system ATP-binding protein